MVDTARSTRQQILDVTATLLERVGAEEVSIRHVCQAAGITAPTVYHYFRDKSALLAAVAAEGFERYLETKLGRGSSEDPLVDLRRGWDDHVGFGLEHPAFYRLMYGIPNAERHPSAQKARLMLLDIVHRLAEAGRLRLPPDQAATTIHVGAVGTALALIANPQGPSSAALVERMREAVFAAVLHLDEPPRAKSAVPELARTLLASLSARPVEELTSGERAILLELLEKLD
jgi:AcrR family transcriptional regulator